MNKSLPHYVTSATELPLSSRVPWYKSTSPAYAGIFLWVGFYLQLAGPTLGLAGVGVTLLGLLVAGVLCFALYYYVPAMLGMQTGRPLYVVATSTFGTTGGYVIPGIMMGVLQLGWVAVVGAVATNFILKGLHRDSKVLFAVIAIVWIYALGWIAIKGIHHVSRVARYLNWIPLAMIVVVLWEYRSGIRHFYPANPRPLRGFLNTLAIVVGYFATAGAAGADFGMNSRNRRDVSLGGITGIIGGVLLAGGISILGVAGHLGGSRGAADYDFSSAIAGVGALAPIMFFLFAAASMVSTCFSSFIAANSFSTMLPSIPRTVSSFAGLTLSAALAATGAASDLTGFFGVVGASFGPICGAMAADYLLEGCRWHGPRTGIHWPGILAWAIGFIVGIPDRIPGLPQTLLDADHPAGLYSFLAGFAVYLVVSRIFYNTQLRQRSIPSCNVAHS